MIKVAKLIIPIAAKIVLLSSQAINVVFKVAWMQVYNPLI